MTGKREVVVGMLGMWGVRMTMWLAYDDVDVDVDVADVLRVALAW